MVIASSAVSVAAGQAYAFQPTASDPDGQVLAFGVANKPSWADFDVATGRLSGTPGAGTAGTYSNIVISVSDGQASATLPAFASVGQLSHASPIVSPSEFVCVGFATVGQLSFFPALGGLKALPTQMPSAS